MNSLACAHKNEQSIYIDYFLRLLFVFAKDLQAW